MKVIVYPGRRFAGNPWFEGFCEGLNDAGCQDVRMKDVLMGRSGFDVIHFHFPDFVIVEYGILQSTFLTFLNVLVLSYAKIARKPVVWMVHDVVPFRNRRRLAHALFMRFFRWCVSGYVFLSESSKETFFAMHPGERSKPTERAPHSRYDAIVRSREEIDALRSKQRIEKNDCLISFLGAIKPYKGVEAMAKLPETIGGSRRVRIAVCGTVDHGMTEDDVIGPLANRSAGSIIRIPGRLDDEALGQWIQMSDAVFMPYQMGTNSGFALFVLSNEGRILSSTLPMFREIEECIGRPWIRTTDAGQPEALAAAIEDLLAAPASDSDKARLEAFLQDGDHGTNGRRLYPFYRELAEAAQGGRRRTESATQ